MIKILLVEDDPLMYHMYSKIFKYEGYEVEIATDGQVGWDKARESRPTLILLDVMMPNLNGLDLLERLKADSQTKDIPVIMLTNLSGTQDAEKALSMGAAQYIIKSEQNPKEVVDLVKAYLEKQKPR